MTRVKDLGNAKKNLEKAYMMVHRSKTPMMDGSNDIDPYRLERLLRQVRFDLQQVE